jgi:hypothetical protein
MTIETTIHNIMKFADRADQLARDLAGVKPESPISGRAGRALSVCRDLHTGVSNAIATLSPELKQQPGIEV